MDSKEVPQDLRDISIQEALEWINKNAKKWNIDEQSSDKIVISKGDVVITIVKDQIHWKTAEHEDRNRSYISLIERNLKILTSRDWIPQTYYRNFGYIARTKEPDKDIWPEDYVQYFNIYGNEYSFVTSIKWRTNYNDYKGGGAIYAETVCSLDKETLNDLNDEIEAQITDGIGESPLLINLSSDGYFHKE